MMSKQIRTGLAIVVTGLFTFAFFVAAAARAAAPEATAMPKDAASSYVIVGPITAAWGPSGVTVGAAAVENKTSKTSEPLFLEL